MSTPKFDVEFEEEVLAKCLRDTEFLKDSARLLTAHHFTTKHHGWIWERIKETWLTFAERTTPKMIRARAHREFEDDDERKLYLGLALKLFRKKTESPRASLAEIQRFVRHTAIVSALEFSIKKVEKGDIDGAFNALRKATLKDIRPKAYTTVKWIEEFDDRQLERKHKREHPEEYARIPTGLKRLDKILSGGMMKKEVGMVMGTTGRGKSIFLNHLGFVAIVNDFYVLHFSLEMNAVQVATRYDSRFTTMAHSKFKTFDFSEDELRLMARRVAKRKKRFKDKLRIISMPVRRCDGVILRNAIEEARSEMPRIDMIIVDSGDHMRGIGKFDSLRQEQAEVYWDLKALAEEEDYLVWSSTQAGREWAGRIATAEAASESYDKSRIVDLALTLNQPKEKGRGISIEDKKKDDDEEKEETPAGDMELFVAKYRDGESKIKIPLETEFRRMFLRQARMEEKE